MSFDKWQWVAEKLGIPSLFVCILCFAIYKTGSWTADHIFTPLVTKHIEFLENEQLTMKSIALDVGKQTSNTERATKLLEDIRNDQKKFPAVAEKQP